MVNRHGDWIWYELLTPDTDGAAAFYTAVIGWTVGNQPGYREIVASEGGVGGMMSLSAEMSAGGAKPGWRGYVAVDDVDTAVTSIVEGGGGVLMPAHDMPGVGRFALVTDPAGAAFYVMRPMPPAGDPDRTSNAFAADHPAMGHCAWNELWTSDPAAALHFYGTRFGWVEDSQMDMGASGKYFMIRHGALTGGIAGVMPGQVPGWTFYFRVPSIAEAVDKVTGNGGTVNMGPHPIPGGDHIILGTDPQGAAFALVGAP